MIVSRIHYIRMFLSADRFVKKETDIPVFTSRTNTSWHRIQVSVMSGAFSVFSSIHSISTLYRGYKVCWFVFYLYFSIFCQFEIELVVSICYMYM